MTFPPAGDGNEEASTVPPATKALHGSRIRHLASFFTTSNVLPLFVNGLSQLPRGSGDKEGDKLCQDFP